jgi:hypothetical protein
MSNYNFIYYNGLDTTLTPADIKIKLKKIKEKDSPYIYYSKEIFYSNWNHVIEERLKKTIYMQYHSTML